MIAAFIGCSIGLTISNFAYQALFRVEPDWAVASERSFFQLIALLAIGATLATRSINT